MYCSSVLALVPSYLLIVPNHPCRYGRRKVTQLIVPVSSPSKEVDSYVPQSTRSMTKMVKSSWFLWLLLFVGADVKTTTTRGIATTGSDLAAATAFILTPATTQRNRQTYHPITSTTASSSSYFSHGCEGIRPTPSSSLSSSQHTLVLKAKASDGDEDSSDGDLFDNNDDDENTSDRSLPPSSESVNIPKQWKLDNDIEQFLNQCSIQSMIFLLNQLRDRQTAIWLEDFTQPIIRVRSMNKNINTKQDYTLQNMAKAMKDAKESTTTSKTNTSKQEGDQAKLEQQQPQGQSQSNQHDEDQQEQEEQEQPAHREIELLTYHGLHVMNTTLYPTWNSYFEHLLKQPKENYLIQSNNRYVPEYELEINPPSLCTRIISIREQICNEFVKDLDVIADLGGQTIDTYWNNLLSLKKKTKKDGEEQQQSLEEEEQQQPQPLAGANMLFLEIDDFSDYVPSPLRKGNFDLLLTLTTQEAIHRLLNNDDKLDDVDDVTMDPSSIQFLRNFYVQRIGTHFTGSQWYGRADSLLQELLTMSPSMIQVQDETMALIDPLRIAELILKVRESVAIEWSDLTLDILQHDLHMDIKRKQLSRLMEGYGGGGGNSGSDASSSNNTITSTEGHGSFD